MIISSLAFFIFSKLWFFRSRVKGEKLVQNVKKLCLLCLITQALYIMWSSFTAHMCNRITPPGFFYIYSKFLFLGSIEWDKRAKNDPKWQKIMSIIFHISGSSHHMIWFLVHMCKIIASSDAFFIFVFNFEFPGC